MRHRDPSAACKSRCPRCRCGPPSSLEPTEWADRAGWCFLSSWARSDWACSARDAPRTREAAQWARCSAPPRPWRSLRWSCRISSSGSRQSGPCVRSNRSPSSLKSAGSSARSRSGRGITSGAALSLQNSRTTSSRPRSRAPRRFWSRAGMRMSGSDPSWSKGPARRRISMTPPPRSRWPKRKRPSRKLDWTRPASSLRFPERWEPRSSPSERTCNRARRSRNSRVWTRSKFSSLPLRDMPPVSSAARRSG